MLSRQVLHHLSHVLSPAFALVIVLDRASHFCSEHDNLTYSFLHRWDRGHVLPHLTCLLRYCLTNFLPWLFSNCDPPNLPHLSSWDNRRGPPYSALGSICIQMKKSKARDNAILASQYTNFCETLGNLTQDRTLNY
jgi:hypothetical protein